MINPTNDNKPSNGHNNQLNANRESKKQGYGTYFKGSTINHPFFNNQFITPSASFENEIYSKNGTEDGHRSIRNDHEQMPSNQ
jgi:hypothetical protein